MSLFKPRPPTQNELRLFAGILVVLAGCLLFALRRQDAPSMFLQSILVLMITAGTIGILAPTAIRPLHRLLMLLVLPLGWLVFQCMLAIVYYLIVTPIGIWRRLRYGDPLRRKFDETKKTYWEPRQHEPTRGSYFRQF